MKESPVIKMGDFEVRLEIEEPTPETLEVARNELRETPERIKASVEELRQLLKGKLRKIIMKS